MEWSAATVAEAVVGAADEAPPTASGLEVDAASRLQATEVAEEATVGSKTAVAEAAVVDMIVVVAIEEVDEADSEVVISLAGRFDFTYVLLTENVGGFMLTNFFSVSLRRASPPTWTLA